MSYKLSIIPRPLIICVLSNNSIFRTLYNACKQSDKPVKSNEVVKSANLLFSTLEPSYVWVHCGYLFEMACLARVKSQTETEDNGVNPVGSGMPNLLEVCVLTEFLLDTVSLDAFMDTPFEHLPGLFYQVINQLSYHTDVLTSKEISKSLDLCAKILSRVQPTVANPHADKIEPEPKPEVTFNSGLPATPISDSSLTPIPLEKSQSDSKLNKTDLLNNLVVDKTPSPRRRANSGGSGKKSDKKSKKKGSKSTSKLSDSYTIQADGSNISVIVSEDAKPIARNKSMDNLKIDYSDTNGSSPAPSETLTPKSLSRKSFVGSNGSLNRGPSPALQAQNSMLEKCLREYEVFYVKLISSRVLAKEKTVNEMFDDLMIVSPRESFNERTRRLESLLTSRLSLEDSGFFNLETPLPAEITFLDYLHPKNESIKRSEWEEAMKIASSLLVELSTFPTYCLPGDGMILEEEPKGQIVLPDWLKVLVVCACFLGRQPSLQLISMATLLDLIALLKAQRDVKPHPQSGEGVTTVVMVPLLKEWHINILEQHTNVFQVS